MGEGGLRVRRRGLITFFFPEDGEKGELIRGGARGGGGGGGGLKRRFSGYTRIRKSGRRRLRLWSLACRRWSHMEVSTVCELNVRDKPFLPPPPLVRCSRA